MKSSAFKMSNPDQTYRCQQILPMAYGLNNSFGKILLVGLENTASDKKDFEPVVRIGAPDFQGFKFSLNAWEGLKKQFDEINDFFTIYNEDALLGTEINIPGYIIRFMISYSDRAFELLEDQPKCVRKNDDENLPPKKRGRYVRSHVFKRVTFERLKDLVNCVDYRIKYLQTIKKCMDIIIKEIVKYTINKMEEENNNNTYASAMNVKYALRNIGDEFIQNICSSLQKNSLLVATEDIYIIVHELINLHLYTLVCSVNESLNK